MRPKAPGRPSFKNCATRLFVEEMGAHHGQDKITKTDAVADMFSSGMVWAALQFRWAEEAREEMAEFPRS